MLDRSIIDEYEHGARKIHRAVAGLSHDDLVAKPIPGRWSTHHLLIHLADAETAFADRIRRILAQDEPLLLAWDENKFSANLHYDDQSAEDAVIWIEVVRRQTARILRAASDADFERAGQHEERGQQTLLDVVSFANTHLDHHLEFIYEKREKLGKPIDAVPA
jgi:uncharacterized damage-inducible protein DinB